MCYSLQDMENINHLAEKNPMKDWHLNSIQCTRINYVNRKHDNIIRMKSAIDNFACWDRDSTFLAESPRPRCWWTAILMHVSSHPKQAVARFKEKPKFLRHTSKTMKDPGNKDLSRKGPFSRRTNDNLWYKQAI